MTEEPCGVPDDLKDLINGRLLHNFEMSVAFVDRRWTMQIVDRETRTVMSGVGDTFGGTWRKMIDASDPAV